MTIKGIGIDLVNIERMQKIITGRPTLLGKFLRRILTPMELQQWHRHFPDDFFASKQHDIRQPAAWLAKHYAAKEAFAKAYGTGIGRQLSFQDISIDHDASGRPLLIASPHLQNSLGQHTNLFLSLSDEYPLAQAMVVLEVATSESN